jgi:hypothetical protein
MKRRLSTVARTGPSICRATVAPPIEPDGKAKFLMMIEVMVSSIERSELHDRPTAKCCGTVNFEQPAHSALATISPAAFSTT